MRIEIARSSPFEGDPASEVNSMIFSPTLPNRPPRHRAVSPVIGVVLMVAVLVMMAAVTASMLTGFGDELVQPAPQASFATDLHPDGEGNGGLAYLNITFEAGTNSDGERLFVVDSDGNQVAWADVWTGEEWVETGEYVHIDGKGSDCALNEVQVGETYRLVQQHSDGSTTILTEYAVETGPQNPPSYDC